VSNGRYATVARKDDGRQGWRQAGRPWAIQTLPGGRQRGRGRWDGQERESCLQIRCEAPEDQGMIAGLGDAVYLVAW